MAMVSLASRSPTVNPRDTSRSTSNILLSLHMAAPHTVDNHRTHRNLRTGSSLLTSSKLHINKRRRRTDSRHHTRHSSHTRNNRHILNSLHTASSRRTNSSLLMDTREVGDSIQARGTEWDGRERVLLLTIGGGGGLLPLQCCSWDLRISRYSE